MQFTVRAYNAYTQLHMLTLFYFTRAVESANHDTWIRHCTDAVLLNAAAAAQAERQHRRRPYCFQQVT